MNAAEAIAMACMTAMEREIIAKQACVAEVEATIPENPVEYQLKDNTLTRLRESIAKAEAHLQIGKIMATAIRNSREGAADQ